MVISLESASPSFEFHGFFVFFKDVEEHRLNQTQGGQYFTRKNHKIWIPGKKYKYNCITALFVLFMNYMVVIVQFFIYIFHFWYQRYPLINRYNNKPLINHYDNKPLINHYSNQPLINHYSKPLLLSQCRSQTKSVFWLWVWAKKCQATTVVFWHTNNFSVDRDLISSIINSERIYFNLLWIILTILHEFYKHWA